MEEGKINPWLETIGVIFIALLGVLLGKLSSCFRKPYWAWGYLVPTILISMLVLTRFFTAKKAERTLDADLVEIDTGRISSVVRWIVCAQ